ncbi:hypothetical protein ACFL2G_02990 [Candidatus Omnitrophota bacterium]
MSRGLKACVLSVVLALVSIVFTLESHSAEIKKTGLRKKSVITPSRRLALPAQKTTEQAQEEAQEEEAPPTVSIESVNLSFNNCQYKWVIEIKNNTTQAKSGLAVGGQQKAPGWNTFHGAGSKLVNSLAPGQTKTVEVGWTRDGEANDYYVYVLENNNELDRQDYDAPSISADILNITFSQVSGNQYTWTAEISNDSPHEICWGTVIAFKRFSDNGIDFAGPNVSDITIPTGESTITGTWDATNAAGLKLRLAAHNGPGLGPVFVLDEQEVPFTP